MTPNSLLAGHEGSRTSWLVGAFTGYKIYKQGGERTALQTLNLAMGWRFWTANLLWWSGTWVVCTAYLAFKLPMRIVLPLALVNLVVIYVAMGLAFVRQCVRSDFRVRGPFAPLGRLAMHVPNVGPFWMYFTPFVPVLVLLVTLGAFDLPHSRLTTARFVHNVYQEVVKDRPHWITPPHPTGPTTTTISNEAWINQILAQGGVKTVTP